MSDSKNTFSGPYSKGQIGAAVLGVSLCAACGLAWIGGGGEPDNSMSFAPAHPAASSPAVPSAASTRPQPAEETAENDKFTVQTAGPENAAFLLIVRFDDEPVLAEIGKSFRQDPEGARQKFRAWASGKPALAGLYLERASYSGELVLSGGGGRSMSDTIAAIEAMDNVAYVEPDYSAKPSKEG